MILTSKSHKDTAKALLWSSPHNQTQQSDLCHFWLMMGLNPETAIRLTNKGNKLVKSQCSIDLLIWVPVTDLSLYQLSFLRANGLIMKNIF